MCESSRGVCGELTPLNWLCRITDFDIAPLDAKFVSGENHTCGRWGLAAGKARAKLVAIGAARLIPLIVHKLMWQCFVALAGNGIGSMTQECGWLGKTYHLLFRHSLSTSCCSSTLCMCGYYLGVLLVFVLAGDFP